MIAAEASEKQYCILLVDDEENILRSLKRELLDIPYSLLTASSASEALELLQSNIVSVVITDQRMPGASGTELLSIVREKYPDTVRILLTAFTDMQDIIEAINKSGIYKFIQKPWNSCELKKIISEAVDHYRLIKDKNLKKQIVQGSAAHDVSQVISGQQNAQSDATRFERPNKA
jgi:response regulator RpfG family c-di-GMP phosphodiesterase